MTDPVRAKVGKAGEGGGGPEAGVVARRDDGHGGVWLTEVLDSEYARYEPDTRRIRTLLDERLEDGAEGAARAARGRYRVPVLGLRLAGIPAGIAAAALCATVAVAVTATVANDHPNSVPRAATNPAGLPTPGGAPTGGHGNSPAGPPASPTHSGATGQGAQTATKSADPSAGPSQSATSAPPPDAGSSVVTATGGVSPSSNPQWTEEDVYITLQDPVTALQLTIRATSNAGYSQENFYSDHDIKKFNVSVNADASGLTYTFTLKPGNTIQPGTVKFGAQYQHTNYPHDTSGDTFSVTVTTDQAHGSASAVAQGGF